MTPLEVLYAIVLVCLVAVLAALVAVGIVRYRRGVRLARLMPDWLALVFFLPYAASLALQRAIHGEIPYSSYIGALAVAWCLALMVYDRTRTERMAIGYW